MSEPVYGAGYDFHVALPDMANPGAFKANPTIAAGDFKISINGGAFANLTTLPTVEPAAGVAVLITLSGPETEGGSIIVTAIDQTSPKEWADAAWNFHPQDEVVATMVGELHTRLGTPSNLGSGATVGENLEDIFARADEMHSELLPYARFMVRSGTVSNKTVGATGNTTTTVHLQFESFGDDELNEYLIGIYDISSGEWHMRWVTDWVGATKLATLHEALPFTPDNADGDRYQLTVIRRDTISAAPTAAQVADGLLGRSLAGGADGGRTVRDALRFNRNKWEIVGTTLTVYEEDDTTPAWTATLVRASADPITSVDPA